VKRLKLLWAEDDESQREVIVDIAAVLKHDVDISIHGKDALKQRSKNRYDVLVTDIGLPVMDG
jgi:CheY-like chemotaxis protein